jgi:hypothetical protein
MAEFLLEVKQLSSGIHAEKAERPDGMIYVAELLMQGWLQLNTEARSRQLILPAARRQNPAHPLRFMR